MISAAATVAAAAAPHLPSNMLAHVGQKVIMVLAALPKRWLHLSTAAPWLLHTELPVLLRPAVRRLHPLRFFVCCLVTPASSKLPCTAEQIPE